MPTVKRDLAKELDALVGQVIHLQRSLMELQRSASEEKLRGLVEKVVTMRTQEIGKLADDATKALRLLIDAGAITQDQANEAIR